MAVPRVSAVVLNYRNPQDTVRCVQSLLAQTAVQKMEILIVDNHSEDESIGMLRNRFRDTPNMRMLETSSNRGYGQGNDFAIRRAQGAYILIINPDNTLESGGVAAMLAASEGDPSIGILSPMLVEEDGRIRDSYRRFPSFSDIFIKRTALRHLFSRRVRHYLQIGDDPFAIRDVDWVAGACLFFRKDLYEELGGFDPRFFLFFEDTDLCRRIWSAGKRVVYFPAVRARDSRHRLSAGGIVSLLTKRTVRIHLKSALMYFWKWRRSHDMA